MIVYPVIGVASFILVFPIYWMIITSIKPTTEIYKTFLVTLRPTFENYAYLLTRTRYLRAFVNSTILATISTALTLFIAAPCAYIITRFETNALSLFTLLLLLVYMIPKTLLIIPVYVIGYKIGAVNSIPHVSVFYLTFALPFCIWLLRSYLAGIPLALEEAALIDGATRFQAFRLVVLPCMKPGLISTAVVAFLMNWQEYLWASVFLRRDELYVLPVLMDSWFGGDTVTYSWGIVMAAAVCTTLPAVLIMVLLQDRLISGMSGGAIKG